MLRNLLRNSATIADRNNPARFTPSPHPHFSSAEINRT
jgi:hypothetical protein